MALDADMAEIAQLFIEESMEGLDTMESSLLELHSGEADPEVMNEIFRAAHSIKGGGATFGFIEISEFAHRVETLLDEMRQGERAVTREIVDLILQSVDCLRDMVSGLAEGSDIDTSAADALAGKFDSLLAGEEPPEETPEQSADAPAVDSTDDEIVGWNIVFEPAADLFQSGNDPLRIFTELATLGDIKVEALGADSLDFDTLDPGKCHLHWRIKVFGSVKREQIDELFAWVADECSLEITPIRPVAPAAEMLVIDPVRDENRAAEPETTEKAPVKGKADATGQPKSRARPKSKKTESGSIRVNTDKVDALINLVGELVITQSMLNRFGQGFDFTQIEALKKGLEQLRRNTRELQESVMQIRMMPISFAFSRFPRLVRDTSAALGKKVELQLHGEGTELDKTVLEKIGDPLVHLVRNSLDHGLEPPDTRKAAGKPETGILSLSAYHEGGNIVIEITDDGAGINRDKVLAKAIERGLVQEDEELSDERIHNLIFLPGFSTADTVSDLSGRGVGMDVVRRNIADLGGHVSVRSEVGQGSTFTIRLPLTVAILDGQLVDVGRQTYIIPLTSIVETVQTSPELVNAVNGHDELFRLRDEYIPIIRLHQLFGVPAANTNVKDGLLVIVESGTQRAGIFVDRLDDQQQVVIKSLEKNFRQTAGISGATILGDGTVALIIDVHGLMQLFFEGDAAGPHKAVA